jgi:hypothetical protein
MPDVTSHPCLIMAENINTKNSHNNFSVNNLISNTPIRDLLQTFTNPFSNIKHISLSTREVENVIKSLKLKNSHGYDEIRTKLLKISSPLTRICNKSLLPGIFLDHLKYPEIKPLFKKGDKLDISEYRPISLLTAFSKVLEKAKNIQLLEHLNKNNVLVEEKFGFRTKSSADKAIYKLTNEILKALNSKSLIGGIFCDLERPLIVVIIKSYYLNWNFMV